MSSREGSRVRPSVSRSHSWAKCYKTFLTPQVTNVCNKLECLSLAKPFQPSTMFASKAGAYPSGAPFTFSTQKQAPGLTQKHQIRLEMPVCLKHCNFLRTFVNYDRKIFITLVPGCRRGRPWRPRRWWSCWRRGC